MSYNSISSLCRSIFCLLILSVFSYGQSKETVKTPSKIEFRLVDGENNSSGALCFPVSGDANLLVAVRPEIIVTGTDIKAVKTRTEKFRLMLKDTKQCRFK